MHQLMCNHCYMHIKPRGHVKSHTLKIHNRACEACGEIIDINEVVYETEDRCSPTQGPQEILFGGTRGGDETARLTDNMKRAAALLHLILAGKQVISTYSKGPAKGFQKALQNLEAVIDEALESI